MKLANIQYGLNPSRYQSNGSISYENWNNTYESSGVSAHLKNKELPTGTQPVTDYDLSIFKGIKGVYIGNKCVTTTPTLEKSIAYTRYSTIFDIYQSGYTSNAFSNYVIGNYKGVWGFECIFQKHALGNTDYFIEYGFDKNNTFHFSSKEECNLLSLLKENDTILFKASRGMALETLINSIK